MLFFLCTSAAKLITAARTRAQTLTTHTHTHSVKISTISCESSLIELTLQLTAQFTTFRSKMEDGGWNKCWASLKSQTLQLCSTTPLGVIRQLYLHGPPHPRPQTNGGRLPFHIYPTDHKTLPALSPDLQSSIIWKVFTTFPSSLTVFYSSFSI